MGLLFFATLAAVYFLPSIVGRQKRNFGAIFALNLLLGWTVIGWVVALVWALTKENVNPIVVQATIQAAAPTCPTCRAVVNIGDVFCTRCGSRVASPAAPVPVR